MKSLISVALLVFSFSLSAQIIPEKYEDLWINIDQKGGADFQNELTQLRQQNPTDPWVYWLSGMSSHGLGENELAITYFKQSVEVDSNFVLGYYYWASMLEETTPADIQLGIDLYSKVLQHQPQDGYSLIFRSRLYLKQEKYDLAMSDCENARNWLDEPLIDVDELHITILKAQNATTELYDFVRQGNFAEHPESRNFYFNMLVGEVYIEMKDNESACKCFQTAKEIFYLIEESEFPAELSEGLKKCKQ